MSGAPDLTVRYCTNCGKALQEGAKFCASCGKQISSFTEIRSEPALSPLPVDAPDAMEQKSSFFGWGRARKPILVFIWVFVLALAFEQLYYDWVNFKAPTQHGAGVALWVGILAAMYAPKRRFFGVLWFFLGVVGSVLIMGI